MTELLTAAAMRALERAAIDSGAVTGLELMERAGQGVVDAVMAEWPELAAGPHRAVVLCGPGNNGGDGFVVARLLEERGWSVRVHATPEAERTPSEAQAARGRWSRRGPILPLTEDAIAAGPPSDLQVDAIFGTGLTRAPEGELAAFLHVFNGRSGVPHRAWRLVAIDGPSGLCLDSGRALDGSSPDPFCDGTVPAAALTVTFHAPRPGHVLADGPEFCGTLAVKDIGLGGGQGSGLGSGLADGPDEGRGQPGQGAARPAPAPVPALRLLGGVPGAAAGSLDGLLALQLGKRGHGHKYDSGHALVLAGGPGKGGAARLAARAALRVGAGLVTVACPPAALQENAARLDAIMLRPVRDAAQLAEILSDARLNALCLGPGFGLGDGTRAMVAAALAAGRPAVLDGDALTAFADDPAALFALIHRNVVLTPHAGEFRRLFPDIADRLDAAPSGGPAFSKVDAAREAAARSGAIVVFKGADTVIASPRGTAAISAAVYGRAAPWLATAGSGDVLAGLVTGLMARGLGLLDRARPAEVAAWLHVECALAFGPGLVAEDLPEQVPAVFRKLGL